MKTLLMSNIVIIGEKKILEEGEKITGKKINYNL
jgi:hypothetical protein